MIMHSRTTNFFSLLYLRLAYALSLLRVALYPGQKARLSKIRLGTLLLSLTVLASCNTKTTTTKGVDDSLTPEKPQMFSCYDTIAPPPTDPHKSSQRPVNRGKPKENDHHKKSSNENLKRGITDTSPGPFCYAPMINTNERP
jgi:hypothetical protein